MHNTLVVVALFYSCDSKFECIARWCQQRSNVALACQLGMAHLQFQHALCSNGNIDLVCVCLSTSSAQRHYGRHRVYMLTHSVWSLQ